MFAIDDKGPINRNSQALVINKALHAAVAGKPSSYIEIISASIGLLNSMALCPVMYVYASRAGGDSLPWQVVYGVCSSVSFSALFARKASIVNSNMMRTLSPELTEILLPRKWLTTENVLYFIIIFVSALPLTYLNDMAGFSYLNIPVMLAQMSTFRWALEHVFNNFLMNLPNLLQCSSAFVQHKQFHKWLGEIVVENSVPNISPSAEREDVGQSLVRYNYLQAFRLSPVNLTDRAQRYGGLLAKAVGWVVGILGSSCYYLVGLKTLDYFLTSYFSFRSNPVGDNVVGVLALVSQGSVCGWALGELFQMIIDKVFAVYRNKTCLPASRDSFLLSGSALMLITIAGYFAAMPRYEIINSLTSSGVLICSAFLAIFALSFMGFVSMPPFSNCINKPKRAMGVNKGLAWLRKNHMDLKPEAKENIMNAVSGRSSDARPGGRGEC